MLNDFVKVYFNSIQVKYLLKKNNKLYLPAL